jgi:hypothetical protein
MITYKAAHDRIRKIRGKASEYLCSDCMNCDAQDWSYRGGSPFEQIGKFRADSTRETARWSTDVWSYDPLCRLCHERRDGRSHTLSLSEWEQRMRYWGKLPQVVTT